MSSFWRGTSDKKLAESELELFKHTGLTEDEYKSYAVPINLPDSEWKQHDLDEEAKSKKKKCKTSRKVDEEQKHTDYIWTIELGAQNECNLVMIHGYGGSGMIFYKMFKRLSEHFHVYLIDILGMGRSSRNEFNCKTFEECERYFVNSIEKWREAMNLSKINLLGHSFGGFIVSRYALFYPENLEKLLFLSPFATEISSPEHAEEFENRIKNAGFFRRQAMKFAVWMYKRNSTPFGVARKAGRLLGGYAIKKGLKRRLNQVPKEEFPALSEYMHQIIMAKGSSEYAFNIMFPNFNVTDKAIMNNLEIYKEKGIVQLRDSGEKVAIIKSAGHHVYFDNPEMTVDLILAEFNEMPCANPFNTDV